MRPLLRLTAKNFLSLREVDVTLGELNVLVGPNGAGKTNLLRAIQFLGDTARMDLVPAIRHNGDFQQLLFRGAKENKPLPSISLGIRAQVTGHASVSTPDDYRLTFGERKLDDNRGVLRRRERFSFELGKGLGQRITINGSRVDIVNGERQQRLPLDSTASGL